ncbi:serine hydrolase domain-containing protein [Erythrobacter sp. NE805]|uniref:serine hydrolase domain-containing protein n=1 Tax=Erythrobacter sp. NE805 TaxID=3389875 RepID=UPI00396B36B4
MVRLLLALAALLVAAPAAANPYEDWADTVIGKGVAAGGASAATVAIVKDGQVVAIRGYGKPAPQATRGIDPAKDHFQIASVSKTFAGLLLLDLVRSGDIPSLDTPANAVLKRIRLPAMGGKPILLRHLLTHSAGFEERGYGYFDLTRVAVPASGDDIRAILPAQVRPAGAASVYANISAPLVALVIEDATGRPYGELLAERLLRPVGMAATRLNLTGKPTARLVVPFAPGGTAIPRSFNAPFFAPTGSIETTAPDMARYMLAMLGEGGAPLAPEVRRMATMPLAGNGPGLDSIGAFWFLSRWGSEPTWEHAGGLSGVASSLVIVPGQRLGLFVAWTASAPPLGYGELRDSFLAQFLGPPQPATSTGGSDPGIAGRYWTERRPHSTAEMLFFLGAVTEVERTAGGITINGKPVTRIGPGLYEEQAGPGRAPARWLFRGDTLRERVAVARKVSGLSDPFIQLVVAGCGLALALTGVLAAIWARGAARWFAPVVALTAGGVPATVFAFSGPEAIANAMQRGETLPFTLGGILTAALLVLGLLLAVLVARYPGRALVRAHLALVGTGALVLGGMLTFWHVPFPLHG